MSEQRAPLALNSTDVLAQTVSVVVAVNDRRILLDLRRCFLDAVDQLERAAGVRPTTAEIRARYKLARNGNLEPDV